MSTYSYRFIYLPGAGKWYKLLSRPNGTVDQMVVDQMVPRPNGSRPNGTVDQMVVDQVVQ